MDTYAFQEPAPNPGSAARPERILTTRTAIAYTYRPLGQWRRYLPAWMASGLVHILLIILLLAFTLSTTADPSLTEQTVIETKVEDLPQHPQNLEQTDIGVDPDLSTQYNLPRIEEVSVPGPPRPPDPVGILNSPNNLPMTVPPPPGLGSSLGQGGGLESQPPGKGNLTGFAEGMGGPLFKPGGFGGRSGATREQMVREGGGNTASEAAVAKGLKWIVKHQAPDGHWSLDRFAQHGHCNCGGTGQDNDTAATAFGLLPMLGAGQTHRPTADKANLYAKNVERALKYLVLRQDPRGDFGGGMYAHGLATIAVCEAYGLTSDPVLQKCAQRAVNFIVAAQSDNGGWRYTPRSGGDTSQVGWQVMALKSAQMAGLDVPSKTLAGATRWLDSCSSPDSGSYGYIAPPRADERASTMTAVGLLCRQYLGWGPRNPSLQAGVHRLKGLPPASINSIYYNYYATQVMHHMGGEAWDFWNPKIRDLLIARQDAGTAHPHQLGSWDPKDDVHGNAGGRVMVSSLSLLTLEVYYRHLPLYRRDQMGGGK
jgi:hypothetical protein